MNGKRIAMWSGPRNISTALMRSWGSRADTYVTDEPFYAHYLRETGVGHPGREEVIRACPSPWKAVASWLTGPVPDQKEVWYQKHMSHHMLPGMIGSWLDDLGHAFLIRNPAAVIASFSRVVEEPVLADLGLEQQLKIFDYVRQTTGVIPPVIDSDDVLKDPAGMLGAFCATMGVPFDQSMLGWEAGPRPTDGVWAKHWYGSVERSTAFQPWREREYHLTGRQKDLFEQCLPYYDELAVHKLTI